VKPSSRSSASGEADDEPVILPDLFDEARRANAVNRAEIDVLRFGAFLVGNGVDGAPSDMACGQLVRIIAALEHRGQLRIVEKVSGASQLHAIVIGRDEHVAVGGFEYAADSRVSRRTLNIRFRRARATGRSAADLIARMHAAGDGRHEKAQRLAKRQPEAVKLGQFDQRHDRRIMDRSAKLRPRRRQFP